MTGPGITPVIERETIPWHPYVTIEKYSADQAQWAEKRLKESLGWRRLPVLNRVPLGEHKPSTLRRHKNVGLVRDLHGDWLRELFPEGPEDGYAHDDGNVLTNVGLTVLINLLVGTGSTNYYALIATSGSNVTAVVGVGTNTTGSGAQATSPCTDTALRDDNTVTAYYQGMDSAYPTLTTPGTINGQSTFGTGVANYAWNEWCWATGPTGTVTAGDHLSAVWSTSTHTYMMNHKTNLYSGGGASLGTKGSGASWVFTTTLTFS